MTNSLNGALQTTVALGSKKTARIQLDHITLDERLQSRELNFTVVKDYAAVMRRGGQFPPVCVVHDDADNYFLVDGHHRVAATRQLHGIETIDAEIINGSFSDALWLSWAANRDHGLRRTQKDKRRAVCAALEHPQWSQKSDREIARHIGCDHKTVASIRRRGEFPKDKANRTARPYQGPSKREILQASRVLAKMRLEQARGFSTTERRALMAVHAHLHQFSFCSNPVLDKSNGKNFG